MQQTDNEKQIPGTWLQPNGTLKNKFGITDFNQLNMVDRALVNLKLSEIELDPIVGYFDKYHLLQIHEVLFGDIYEFAGKIRNVDIEKGGTLFCKPNCIQKSLEQLLYHLYKEPINSKEDMVRVVSNYYAELNMIHPFREGNGRTNRYFFRLYAKSKGYDLSFVNVSPKELLDATIYSVKHDTSKLYSIFDGVITEIDMVPGISR